jgi:hypothetical protein
MMNKKAHAIATPRKLSDDFEEPLSVVSYHVATLAECRAIQLVDTERVRGATQHFYQLSLKTKWARTALRTTKD